MPSRYGDDLPDELPEVAAFVKADEEDGIVAVIDGVLGVEREIAAYIPQVKRTVEGAVAYVKISDGCNRFCSFCMIPYIRGRYHSRNAESIISEVRDLVSGGVREIVLIGQDDGHRGVPTLPTRTSPMARRAIWRSCCVPSPRPCARTTSGSACSICSPRA